MTAKTPFKNIKLPTWFPDAARALMEAAEVGIPSGEKRKEFVTDGLKKLLRQHDFKKVPDWLEHPVEDAIVECVVEILWALYFAEERQPVGLGGLLAKLTPKG